MVASTRSNRLQQTNRPKGTKGTKEKISNYRSNDPPPSSNPLSKPSSRPSESKLMPAVTTTLAHTPAYSACSKVDHVEAPEEPLNAGAILPDEVHKAVHQAVHEAVETETSKRSTFYSSSPNRQNAAGPPKPLDFRPLNLLAGDIEQNPGPSSAPKSQTSKHLKELPDASVKKSKKVKVLSCTDVHQVRRKQLISILTKIGPKTLLNAAKNTQDESTESIVDKFLTSTEYQRLESVSPQVILCFDGVGEYVCTFSELDRAKHDIVVHAKVKENYKLKDICPDFIDLKKMLYQINYEEHGVLDLPWCCLTKSQMLSLAKDKCQGTSFQKAINYPNSSFSSCLSAMIKQSRNFKKQFNAVRAGLFDNHMLFGFGIEDPLNISWSMMEDVNTPADTASIRALFRAPLSNQDANAPMDRSQDLPALENRHIIDHPRSVSTNGESLSITTKPLVSELPDVSEDSESGSRIVYPELLDISDISLNEDIANNNMSAISILPTNVTRNAIDITLQSEIEMSSHCRAPNTYKNNDKVGTSSEEALLKCCICNLQTTYYDYVQEFSGQPMAETHYKIAKELNNYKWFCNGCNNIDLTMINRIAVPKFLPENLPINITEQTRAKKDSTNRSPDELLQEYTWSLKDINTTLEDQTRNLSAQQEIISRIEENLTTSTGWEEIAKHGQDIIELKIDKLTATVQAMQGALLDQDNPARSVEPNGNTYNKIATDKRLPPAEQRIQQPAATVEKSVNPLHTVIILNVQDFSLIKNSTLIKKNFRAIFGDINIKHCFTSKGGTVFIELESEDDVEHIKCEWQKVYFTINNNRHDSTGKGTSCVKLADLKRCVLAKDVPTDISDTDLQLAINKNYPSATVKRFVRRTGDRMTTVKIDFAQTEEYERCLKEGNVKVGERVHNVVQFEPKQRVIQCYRCFKFGHVAKLCSRQEQRCNLCSKNHNEQNCMFWQDKNCDRFKCSNCGGKHESLDRKCPSYKKVVDKIRAQSNNLHNG